MKVLDKNYQALTKRLPLAPLESEADYETARKILHELMQNDPNLTDGEIAYFKVLVLIVEDYSSLHLEGRFEDEARGNEILESLMQDHGFRQVDIAEIAGMPKQKINDFLAGRRGLPREARQKLADRFKLRPDIFELSLPKGQ